MKEIWKDIPTYDGIYQVSNFGNVRSLRYNKIKIMASFKHTDGYLCVAIRNNGIARNRKIHQLVAMAFLNHIPNGHQLVVDHINDDKLDNRIENLQIVTQRYNSRKTQGKYSSKYKGVSWSKNANKWRAQIQINNKLLHLGLFKCELKAKLAYDKRLAHQNPF
jgi:hypothetical protein